MENKKNGALAIAAFICLFIALIPYFLYAIGIICIILVLPYACISAFFDSNLVKEPVAWIVMGIPFIAVLVFGLLIFINEIYLTFKK